VRKRKFSKIKIFERQTPDLAKGEVDERKEVSTS